jgi:peptide-methionine (S)-S-oxide reductase
MATATFGAGCFWGVEAAFRDVPGVLSTAVGYAGGTLANPTYEQVCSGRTGHAEVVQIEYDPARIGFEALLEIFWASHDPTQRHRQGPDVGSQYRSVIFAHDAEQARAAEASKAEREAAGCHRRPIVTEIVPFAGFWLAESYHQQDVEKRRRASGA